MQLVGGCSSGSLYALGGGDGRTIVVLIFFCIGALVATLHLGTWDPWPSLHFVVLGELLGLGWALLAGLAGLAAWLRYQPPLMLGTRGSHLAGTPLD